MTVRIWLCTLAVALGCATTGTSGPPGVSLSVDRDTYRPGDSLTVTLTNRSASQIGYNLCPMTLDMRSGNDWTQVASLTEVCTMELRLLEPGASATYRHRLPQTIGAGEYRVRTSVEAPTGSGMVGVASDAFRAGS